jgi:hypothetical protein
MAKAKTKIQKLDPCLPNPKDCMTPAELVAWERRLRQEKAEDGCSSAAQDPDEKD